MEKDKALIDGGMTLTQANEADRVLAERYLAGEPLTPVEIQRVNLYTGGQQVAQGSIERNSDWRNASKRWQQSEQGIV